MVYYDSDIRLQLAREQAERLATEMRRSRRPKKPDVVGHPRLARLGSALAGQIEGLRRHKGAHTPAYHG
jgi:hypothetical protein